MGKTALVFGSSGLVGSALVQWLESSPAYDRIRLFLRTPIPHSQGKTEFIPVDFNQLERIAPQIEGDEIFCCLGTTIRKAGSQAAFRKVDAEYPSKIASIARQNGVKGFYVVSSLGASADSGNFYLRTKGEMEQAVLQAQFPEYGIFRPSLLLGSRKEFRFGEKLAQWTMPLFHWMLNGRLRKYRGIRAADVAKAMVIAASMKFDDHVFESDRIAEIAKNHNI